MGSQAMNNVAAGRRGEAIETALAVHAQPRPIRHRKGDQEGVDGQPCGTGRQGRDEDGEQRSRRSGRARAAITAGTAHAIPPTGSACCAIVKLAHERPDKAQPGHGPTVLKEGDEPKEDHDLGQEDEVPASPANAPSTIKLLHVSGRAALTASMPEAIHPSAGLWAPSPSWHA